jgi:hypothetical protein
MPLHNIIEKVETFANKVNQLMYLVSNFTYNILLCGLLFVRDSNTEEHEAERGCIAYELKRGRMQWCFFTFRM